MIEHAHHTENRSAHHGMHDQFNCVTQRPVVHAPTSTKPVALEVTRHGRGKCTEWRGSAAVSNVVQQT
eukprot:9495477-Pyramimonas_sp.AAC.1